MNQHKAHPDSDELALALTRLEKANLRHTQPRITLLKTLIAEHGPFSVDELRELPGMKLLDRVTIYRCISAFEDAGLVRRCEFGDGVSRYEFAASHHHHHHVICKKCRKMENIDKCIPASLRSLVREMGYADVTHSLEFFGVCRACRSA